MRVAVFLSGYAPESGGAFTFQATVFEALQALSSACAHEFVIYTEAEVPGSQKIPQGWASRAASRSCLLLNELQDKLLPRRWVTFKAWFEQSLDREGIDFVWFATPAFAEPGRPYLYTLWDLQHFMQPWFPEVGAEGEWQRRQNSIWPAIARAAGVIVANEAANAELMLFCPMIPSRVLELHHPTPAFALNKAKLVDDVADPALELPNEYLFYPAQFWPHKNHWILITALKYLKEQRGRKFNLVLVGSDKGTRDYIIQAASEQGVRDQVHLLGFVPLETLVHLYRNATALVFPSYFGPENLPPLEAFALGCPVIASDVDGAGQQLGDGALRVNPRSAEAWADAILEVESNQSLRQALIARGREIAERCSGQAYVAKVFRFLDDFESIRACWPAAKCEPGHAGRSANDGSHP